MLIICIFAKFLKMIIGTDIEKAAEIIRNGGLVAFPTETVYGLGANALNTIAVAKIFEVKERPTFDPLIVHIANIEKVSELTQNVDKRVYDLATKFWPGPLTIVLPKKDIIQDIVTSGLGSVGLRMPNNNIALELIRRANCPIAAPSANKFGRISPTTASHVAKQNMNIDYIIDGGSTTVGIESTVITLLDDGFVILRNGFITEDDLQKIVPKSKNVNKQEISKLSPGNVDSHYSPSKPLYIVGQFSKTIDKSKAAFVAFRKDNIIDFDYKVVEYLTQNGDLKEAAVNFFSILHKLEDCDVENIVIESVPETSIGKAIMERMRKAAFRYLT
mgnify:CR=1 FL=1